MRLPFLSVTTTSTLTTRTSITSEKQVRQGALLGDGGEGGQEPQGRGCRQERANGTFSRHVVHDLAISF